MCSFLLVLETWNVLLRYDVNSYCKAEVLYKKDFENAVVS